MNDVKPTAGPKVSVLIPTYNYARFLDDAIGSVLNQTFSNYEIIIVDNASTDNTDEVVSKYLVDKRVRFYRNETNIGLVGNWNKCLDYASGELIKFLCADDIIRPTMLEKYVRLMDQYPNVSMVACNKQVFGAKDNYKVELTVTHLQTGRDMNLHTLYGHQGVGEPSSVMFRKRDADKLGHFTGVYEQYVDLDYWFKLCTLGDCYLIPEILVDVRFHPDTVSNQVKKKKFQRCFEDYKIRKDVQQHVYNIDTTGSQIDEMVHKYALICVKTTFKRAITSLHQKQARMALVRTMKIAWEEKLFSSLLMTLGSKITGPIKKKMRKPAQADKKLVTDTSAVNKHI